MEDKTLDHIIYRGGLLEFTIPDEWVHEIQDDLACYYDPDSNGTTRVHVISINKPGASSVPDLMSFMQQVTSKQKISQQYANQRNHPVFYSVSDSIEENTPLTQHKWVVGQLVAPGIVRLAVVTLTLLTGEVGTAQAIKDLENARNLVSNLKFHGD